MPATQLQLFCVSSLEKIFPDTRYFTPSVHLKEDTMLLGYVIPSNCILSGKTFFHHRHLRFLKRLTGRACYFEAYRCGSSMLPNFPEGDDFVLRNTPGLYPDPLQPFDRRLKLLPGQWHSLWVTIPAHCTLTAGTYDLTVTFTENSSGMQRLQLCHKQAGCHSSSPDASVYPVVSYRLYCRLVSGSGLQ